MITLRPYQEDALTAMTYNIIKETIVILEIKDKRLKPDSPKKVAIRNGLVFFQGKICKRGHDSLRYTKGGQCVACIELARNQPVRPKQRSNQNHQLSLNAAAIGQTTYVPSKPCKHGHLLRFVNSNNCVECDKYQISKHQVNAKFARIKKLYGLSKEEYLKLVKEQSSSCKLCGFIEEDFFKLHVDHCHETNKVRGLLCGTCNQGIGLLKHNSHLLRKAALYCEET